MALTIVSVKTLTAPPAAPTITVTAGSSTVALSCTVPATTGQSVISSYQWERSPSGSGSWTVIATTADPSYTDTSPISGANYYRVAAIDQYTTGTRSDVQSCSVGPVVKWYPGHFKRLGLGDNHSTAWNDILSDTSVRGGHAIYRWATLEPTKDSYDFSKLLADIAILSAGGKYYSFEIWAQNFTSTSPTGIIPEYVLTDSTYGNYGASRSGSTVYGVSQAFQNSTGCIAAVWTDVIGARIRKLYQALGAALDSNPWLACVNSAETIVGFGSATKPSNYSDANLAAQWNALIPVAAAAFPTTPVCLLTNYLDASGGTQLYSVMQTCLTNALGIGGPDIKLSPSETTGMLLAQNNLSPSTIDFRGRVPICLHSERALGYTPSQLYGYAVGTMGAHFVMWQNQSSGDVNDWSAVKTFIDAGNQTNQTLPSCY